jgi:hypothetical protein
MLSGREDQEYCQETYECLCWIHLYIDHLTLDVEFVIHAMITGLGVMPGGKMTLPLKGLDVVVNKPFTYHLKHVLTPNGKIKKPCLLCQWIRTVATDLCRNYSQTFIRCCICNAVDG